MKRFLLVVTILFLANVMVFSQQQSGALGTSSRPTSAQTRDTASQFLTQSKSNSSQFDTNQTELNTRNAANADARSFDKLRSEIDKLESQIRDEQTRSAANLNRGARMDQQSLDRIQRLMEQHKAKIAELEAFTSGR